MNLREIQFNRESLLEEAGKLRAKINKEKEEIFKARWLNALDHTTETLIRGLAMEKDEICLEFDRSYCEVIVDECAYRVFHKEILEYAKTKIADAGFDAVVRWIDDSGEFILFVISRKDKSFGEEKGDCVAN